MVDHQVDRDQRIDLLRIATDPLHRRSHRRQINDRRNAGEVLQDDAIRLERDLLLGRIGGVPAARFRTSASVTEKPSQFRSTASSSTRIENGSLLISPKPASSSLLSRYIVAVPWPVLNWERTPNGSKLTAVFSLGIGTKFRATQSGQFSDHANGCLPGPNRAGVNLERLYGCSRFSWSFRLFRDDNDRIRMVFLNQRHDFEFCHVDASFQKTSSPGLDCRWGDESVCRRECDRR